MSDEFSVSLTVKLPSGETKALEFTSADPIMVGSGASVQVRIEDDDVSSLHAMIKPKNGGMVVLDLGSDEGTEVNGTEITGETALEDGDVVGVGKARLTVHFGGEMLAPTVPIRSVAALQGHAGSDGDTLRDDSPPGDLPDRAAKMPDKTKTMAVPPPDDDETMEAEIIDDDPTADMETVNRMEAEKKTAKKAKADKPKAEKKSAKKAKPAKAEKAAKPEKKKTTKAEKPKAEKKAKSTKKDKPTMSEKSEKPVAAAGGGMPKSKKLNTDLSDDLGNHEKPVNKAHVDVTMKWGGSVMGVQRLSGQGVITIGDGEGNSFRVSHPSIPALSHPLVTLGGQGATINAAQGMTVTVDGDAKSGTVNLEQGQKAVISVGAIEFVVQYTQRYAGIDLGLFQTLDFLYAKVFAVAMIFQIALVIAMLITFVGDNLEDDDLNTNANEFAELILKKQEEKKEKKEDLSGKKAARHKDDEGKFGKKKEKQKDALASKKGAPTVDKDKREEDRKLAMDALAALGLSGPEGAVSNVLGPGGLGSGINNALGGLRGASMGDAGGLGGMGTRGAGAGGGGNALGIGGLGSGTGRGSGGRGGIDLGGRGKGMTRVRPGKVTFKGSLSREEIQRVIKRAQSRIRYCYEKELQKNPNLQGKIVIAWTISGSGSVSTAKPSQNTMGNAAVGSCVTRVIKSLRFPRPRGGGSVFVTYPWVFSAK
jgi:hypothetical protein